MQSYIRRSHKIDQTYNNIANNTNIDVISLSDAGPTWLYPIQCCVQPYENGSLFLRNVYSQTSAIPQIIQYKNPYRIFQFIFGHPRARALLFNAVYSLLIEKQNVRIQRTGTVTLFVVLPSLADCLYNR